MDEEKSCGGGDDDAIPISKAKAPKRTCIKCNEKPSVIYFRTDSTCWPCFQELALRKFKLGILRARKDKHKRESYLLCFSCGPSSRAMLKMIEQTGGDNARKKIMFSVDIIFVYEAYIYQQANDMNYVEHDFLPLCFSYLQEISKLYGYKVYVVGLDQLYSQNIQINQIKEDTVFHPSLFYRDEKHVSQLQLLFSQCHTFTAKEDLLLRMRSDILQKSAVLLKSTTILLGTPADRCAALLVANTCLGRGHSFPGADFPNSIPTLQPMRDFLGKEIAIYNRFSDLKTLFYPNFSTKKQTKSSIFSLSETFVNGLQKDYSHTVHTLLKSEEKLNPADSTSSSCIICRSPIIPFQPGPNTGVCQTSSSTTTSASSSSSSSCGSCGCGNSNTTKGGGGKGRDILVSNLQICYGCARMMKEMDSSSSDNLPAQQQHNPKPDLYNMIKDFLIEEEEEETTTAD